MKSVLISIQPKWCELIASGKKTVEVRKTRPQIATPFKVYIYCTKGRGDCLWRWNGVWYDTQDPNHRPNRLDGKVIGEFVCDSMTSLKADNMIQAYYNNTQETYLTDEEIKQYANNGKLYYWHISDLVIYDKPKELSEFYQIGKSNDYNYYDYCSGCPYHETPVSEYPCAKCDGNRKYLYRPPQSWCYVESEDTE